MTLYTTAHNPKHKAGRPAYRYKVTPFSLFDSVTVKLQAHVFGPFYTTAQEMIPFTENPDLSLDELIEWAKDELWLQEQTHLRRRNEIKGLPAA